MRPIEKRVVLPAGLRGQEDFATVSDRESGVAAPAPGTARRLRAGMPPAAPGERLAARAGVLLLPRLYRGTRRGRCGSGDLPRVREAPATRHLHGDGGTPGAGVRVLRRHP